MTHLIECARTMARHLNEVAASPDEDDLDVAQLAIDACETIDRLIALAESRDAYAGQYKRLVHDALPIVNSYANDHPRWMHGSVEQDPQGAHEWLAAVAALSKNTSRTGSSETGEAARAAEPLPAGDPAARGSIDTGIGAPASKQEDAGVGTGPVRNEVLDGLIRWLDSKGAASNLVANWGTPGLTFRQLVEEYRSTLGAAPAPLGVGNDEWLILFDDAEVRPEVFTGPGAEASARKRFEDVSTNWNAHLFRRVTSNTREATPSQGNAPGEK